MVISASLQACGVVFPFAMLTSICRSIVTICSGLYLLIGMTRFSSKWILSHSTWYKFRRSRHHAVQLSFRGNSCLGTRVGSGAESFDSLHVENYAVFLLNIAAHISATEVGVYVRQNKEPAGRRSSSSLECSLLPGLRGHQQQS